MKLDAGGMDFSRDPKSWESLGTGPRLQGLAMVAHGGRLYRIASMSSGKFEKLDLIEVK
jgi:hypothetical protein